MSISKEDLAQVTEYNDRKEREENEANAIQAKRAEAQKLAAEENA